MKPTLPLLTALPLTPLAGFCADSESGEIWQITKGGELRVDRA